MFCGSTSALKGGCLAESNDGVALSWGELFREAVERCGDDMARLQSYVLKRIASLPGQEQESLNAEFSRILAFRMPARPRVLH
jgi:hypothetical protein